MIPLICRLLKKNVQTIFYLRNRNRLSANETYGSHRGVGVGRIDWVLEIDIYTWLIFKIANQQASTVEHRELCSIFCTNLNGKIIYIRIDTCTCITESLCYKTETNTTLLINYVRPC